MEKSEFTTAEIMEKVEQKRPEPILLGAILSQGNNLPINKPRFYEMIREMQSGIFDYPESMKSIVDDISFNETGEYPESEQIESMYVRLSITKKVDFNNTKSSHDNLQMSDETLCDFLERYADDYEALEFFDRCGEYLSVLESETT
jgi:hypothetical protein